MNPAIWGEYFWRLWSERFDRLDAYLKQLQGKDKPAKLKEKSNGRGPERPR